MGPTFSIRALHLVVGLTHFVPKLEDRSLEKCWDSLERRMDSLHISKNTPLFVAHMATGTDVRQCARHAYRGCTSERGPTEVRESRPPIADVVQAMMMDGWMDGGENESFLFFFL